MQLDEKRLVELAQSGDIDAFGELYERLSPGVFNLVFRMLGNREDAEDARQEVFLKAHAALGSFRGGAKFSTWIYRIATNVCLDHLRRRKDTLSTDDLSEKSNWEPSDNVQANNPELDLEQRLTQEAVHAALMDMAAHYRILVVLRHIEDMSYEEIAQIVGCSVRSLNVRLHRARNAFRKAITPYLKSEESEGDLPSGTKPNIAL